MVYDKSLLKVVSRETKHRLEYQDGVFYGAIYNAFYGTVYTISYAIIHSAKLAK